MIQSITHNESSIYVLAHEGEVTSSLALEKLSGLGSLQLLMDCAPTVRNNLDIECVDVRIHESICADLLVQRCRTASEFWPASHYWVEYGYGMLKPGRCWLMVGVSAPTVQLAMSSAQFVYRGVSKQSPVWHRDHRVDGSVSQWIAIHDERVNPVAV